MDPTNTSIKINVADLPSPYKTLKKLSLTTELELDMGNAFSAMSLQDRVQFASNELLKKYERNRTFWDGVLDFLKRIFCCTPEYDKVLEFCQIIKDNSYKAPVDPNVEADMLIKHSDDYLIDAFKMVPEHRKTLVAFSLVDKLLHNDRIKEAGDLLRAYPNEKQRAVLDKLRAEESEIKENYKINKRKIEGTEQRRHRIAYSLVLHYINANDEASAVRVKYDTGIFRSDVVELISDYQKKYKDIIDNLPLDQIADKVKYMSEDAKRHAVNRALDIVKNKDDIKEAYNVLMCVGSEEVQIRFITAFLLSCQRHEEFSTPEKILERWRAHFTQDHHKIFREIALKVTSLYLKYISTHPSSRPEARDYASFILEECPDLALKIFNKICAFEVDRDLLITLSSYYGYDVHTIRELYIEAQIAYEAANPSEKEKVHQRIQDVNNIDLSNFIKYAPTNLNRGKPTFYNA